MSATKSVAACADTMRAEAQLCGLCADDGQCMSRSKLCQVMRAQAPVGINGLTEAKTNATTSVMGLSTSFERKRPDDTEGGEL